MKCSLCDKDLLWNSEEELEDFENGIQGFYTCVNKYCHIKEVIIYSYDEKKDNE